MSPLEQSSEVERQAADTNINNSGMGQRLRSAILGANEGLVYTASLMMGIGDVKKDEIAMILYGLTGLVAGARNIAIREFISVYLDTELIQMKREKDLEGSSKSEEGKGGVHLPSPMQAAAAAAHAFLIGGMMPLLAAAFIKPHKVLGVVIAATLVLMLSGGLRAKLGRAPVGRSCLMVMVEGWFAMLMNFGLMKLFHSLGQ